MVKLNLAALDGLPPHILTPEYAPQGLTTGIVHFGVGGFHRSHEAMYIDRLLNLGAAAGTASGRAAADSAAADWAICGVGVLPSDLRMREVLAEQDHLYTLLTKAPNGEAEARVIGAITEFLYAPDAPEAVIEKLAQPSTRIVSLTITEGGYAIHNGTGAFDPTVPDIAHDLQAGAVPRTAFGFIVEGLRRRRERGLLPFTVMSCDNMQGNGHVTRHALVAFARLKDPDLGEWIAHEAAFPNSMVDRITPVTTDQLRSEVASTCGIEDRWPVLAEAFTQWVLEDHFTLGRPALEQVGVQLVDDVEPYELMKLRLLNASHQAMSYLGLLAGYRYVHELCQHPVFTTFLLDYMTQEATPTLRPVPGIDLAAYRHELIARFASSAIQDTLARQIVDSSERIPKFLLPVVRGQLAVGGEVRRAALVIAAWSEYLHGLEAEGGTVTDQRAAFLLDAVRRDAEQPGAFLDQPEVFGDLGQSAVFRAAYLAARRSLRELGPLGAMQALAAAPAPVPLPAG